MSLGLKSGRKPTRQQCERFTPVPEDELAPQPRSRSASGSSILRRVRSLREKDPYPPSAKESAKEMKRTVSPELSLQKRSNSAIARGASRSSYRGSAGRKGGMDRSISSSPHRAKKRSMLGIPDGLRPTSPSPGRPLKSAMKKSSSPTRVHSATPSPVPGRSRSSERKTPLDVFSRLYPGSGGSGNHLLGESDSRFAGINDTLRIRKKKDSKSGMVDFDGVVSNLQASGNMHEFTVSWVSRTSLSQLSWLTVFAGVHTECITTSRLMPGQITSKHFAITCISYRCCGGVFCSFFVSGSVTCVSHQPCTCSTSKTD